MKIVLSPDLYHVGTFNNKSKYYQEIVYYSPLGKEIFFVKYVRRLPA